MADILTWRLAKTTKKTGTSLKDMLKDLDDLITSKKMDNNFTWFSVPTYENDANASPDVNAITLFRKDGSPGAILLFGYNKAPTSWPKKLFGEDASTPTINSLFISYFPSAVEGKASTINLVKDNSQILSNDSGCLMVQGASDNYYVYSATKRLYYLDSYDGVIICSGNPASTTGSEQFMWFAGNLIVDGTGGTTYCACSPGVISNNFLGQTSGLFSWYPKNYSLRPGISDKCWINMAYNQQDVNYKYFQAWVPCGGWATAKGENDLLIDNSNAKAYFHPVQLMNQQFGENNLLKLRQIGYGPGTFAPLSLIKTANNEIAAISIQNCENGSSGNPWAVNFEL